MRDNLLARYERKKEREEQEKKKVPTFSAKDVLTLVLSSIAVLISATTAYFTFVQQTERLEATVTEAPQLSRKGTNQFVLEASAEFAFVNSGSQSIAIVDALYQLHRVSKAADETECASSDVNEVDMTGAGAVIKPSEIVVKRFGVKGGKKQFTLANSEPASVPYYVVGCVIFRLVTASGGEIASAWVGSWYVDPKAKDNESDAARTPEAPSPYNRSPLVLVDRWKLRWFSSQ